ncbi:MAG: hypothetical protein M0P63_17885 [Azoarcus sp.]|nr:hypothetical protein [Azoarcus sp.]
MHGKFLLFLVCATLLTQPVGAQTVLEFDIWMQVIDRKSQSILRNISARDAEASAADARELGRLYRLMEGYYEKLGDAEDAVISSYEGRERAAQAVGAIEREDYAAAWDSALWIARDCQNCHLKYKPIKR